MFTGIISAQGQIRHLQSSQDDIRLTVDVGKLDMTDVQLGDSIATNGVCLTVTDFGDDYFCADVSNETIARTAFAEYQKGQAVNLEKALAVGERLGGHLVSGHVDGIGEVISVEQQARWVQVWVQAPAGLAKYIAEKGSITVDGVSLTVNAVQGATFRLTLIPQTMQETTFHLYQPGSKVNLEVDLIARYLERLLLGNNAATDQQKPDISMAFLAEHGFVKSR